MSKENMSERIIKLGLILSCVIFIYSSNSNTMAGDIEHNMRCIEKYNRCAEKCDLKIEFQERQQCINNCWEDYQWCLKD